MAKTFTFADVAAHSKKSDLWLVYREKVLDATKFVDEHPYVTSWDRDNMTMLTAKVEAKRSFLIRQVGM